MNKKIIVGSLLAAIVLIGGASIAWAANNNYQGFRAIMGNRASSITEQNFDRFNEMHRLMLNGDYAGAQQIRTELGLGQGKGNGGCRGINMSQGNGTRGGCPMANGEGAGFVDKNNNGVCDLHENIK